MFNKKEYMKEYRKRNLESTKKYNKRYYKDNIEMFKRVGKEYNKTHKEYFRDYYREWSEGNRDKIKVYFKKTYYANLQKHYCRSYARHYKFRRPFCLLHILEGKEVPSIHFHHTDYEFNLGFSVCREHHNIADRWVENEV